MVRTQNGFTIIELLVVIAIIGILAAVILSSLRDARDQGVEAKIKSEVDSIAKRAAIERTQGGTFDVVCGSNGFATSTVIETIITSINDLASSTVSCNSTNDAYAVSVPVSTAHWCADSTGVKRQIAAALPSGQTTCP